MFNWKFDKNFPNENSYNVFFKIYERSQICFVLNETIDQCSNELKKPVLHDFLDILGWFWWKEQRDGISLLCLLSLPLFHNDHDDASE